MNLVDKMKLFQGSTAFKEFFKLFKDNSLDLNSFLVFQKGNAQSIEWNVSNLPLMFLVIPTV